MDLDLKVAHDKFAEMLGLDRGLTLIVSNSEYQTEETLSAGYKGPSDEQFNGKMERILSRFGWTRIDIKVEETTKRVYIEFTRDTLNRANVR